MFIFGTPRGGACSWRWSHGIIPTTAALEFTPGQCGKGAVCFHILPLDYDFYNSRKIQIWCFEAEVFTTQHSKCFRYHALSPSSWWYAYYSFVVQDFVGPLDVQPLRSSRFFPKEILVVANCCVEVPWWIPTLKLHKNKTLVKFIYILFCGVMWSLRISKILRYLSFLHKECWEPMKVLRVAKLKETLNLPTNHNKSSLNWS